MRKILIFFTLFGCLAARGDVIRGVVVDGAGAVIAGARIEAAGAKLKPSVSGADGSFSVDIGDATTTTLQVSASGFAMAKVRLIAPPTHLLTVRLHASGGSHDIDVVARRAQAAVSETAESVSIISEDVLRSSAAFIFDDQLKQSPGFNLFRRSDSLTANPTSQGVSFRGIGASGASRTLVLADGIPLNDPFGGWVYWDRIPRAAIDHVELLEGGASELYGSTALSGVIDVFSRTPSDQWLVLESSGGTHDTPEGSAYAGTHLGSWSIFGSGGGYSTGGFIPTPAANRGRVDVAADSRDRNGMLTVAKDYTGGSLSLSGLYFHESRDNGTPVQTNDTNIGEGDARWTQAFKGGSLSGTFFGSGQSYNQSFSSIAIDRNTESLTRLQHVPAQRIGGGLHWSNSSAARQQWTFGGDAQSVRGFSLETGFASGNATVKTSAGGTQRSFGFFAQDTIRATSRLIFSAGLRLDHWANLNAASISQSLSTGISTAQPFADRDENFVSPHASMLLRLNNSWALTFSGSRAFRAPTLNELYRGFRLGNVLTNANTALTAEQLFGGEGGVIGNIQRVHLRAVIFGYQVQDPVANVTLSATPALITRQRQNLGETSSRGVELTAGSEVVRNLSWQVGYQFTRAVVEDFPADVTLAGKNVPQVPAHVFTFQGMWQTRSWQLSAQGRASGNQFDDDQNALRLGRAFALDAMLAKNFGSGVTLFVAGQNLTNDRYLTARTPTPQEAWGITGRAGIRIELPSREVRH